MKLKKLTLAVLSTIVFFSSFGTFSLKADNDDKIILLTGNSTALINGTPKKISGGSVPFVDRNGHTMIPIRFVSEALSCKIDWDGQNQKITIENNNIKSFLTIGSTSALIGNKTIEMSTAPIIKNDRVFVPIKELSEDILNKKVESSKEGLIGISATGNLFSGNQTEILALIKKISGIETVATKEKYIELINSVVDKNQEEAVNDMVLFDSIAVAGDSSAKQAAVPESASSYSRGGGYAETNLQVQGVDEADVVKTDGEYIYYVANGNVYIVDAKNPSNLLLTKKLDFQSDNKAELNPSASNFYPSEIYVDKNTMTIIGSYYEETEIMPLRKSITDSIRIYPFSSKTKVLIYDITNKSNIEKIKDFYIDGNYSSSRKIDNILYLITNNYIYDRVSSDSVILPSYYDSARDEKLMLDYNRIYYFPEINTTRLMNISSIDVDNPNENVNVETFLGSSENIYCSEENLYTVISDYSSDEVKSKIFKFALNNGSITFAGQGEVPGRIINQFSMDENKNYFRIATTIDRWTESKNESENNIYILDSGLSITGRLTGLAPGEQIKSARFMGDKIYLVTFETVDPLFVIDAKNPSDPKVLGELKIPGYSMYLHPYDENHLIGFGYDTKTETVRGNETVRNGGFKLSMFDVSDVNNPKELFNEIIGDEGTYSELLYNHKSLMFDKQRNLIAFPINIVKQKIENIDGSTYFANYQFNGAVVYTVSLQNGFGLKNQISQMENVNDYSYYINRIIYINDNIFTLSLNKILATDLNSGQNISSLILEKNS